MSSGALTEEGVGCTADGLNVLVVAVFLGESLEKFVAAGDTLDVDPCSVMAMLRYCIQFLLDG